tara:strand:+ start:312 stop:830 length:519 start_codon:yes stop_codon:yes gene_type:complete
MSSLFQKSFSAKSPITTSPFAAGGYASGVDGMRYVSPKQPVSKPVAKPVKDKVEPLEKISTVIPELPTVEGVVSKRKEILEKIIKTTEPGKKIIVEKNNQKYLDSFKPGYARDNEGFGNITDYRKYKEKQNAAKAFEQDQIKTNEYTTDIKGVETLTEEGEYVNVGDRRQIR